MTGMPVTAKSRKLAQKMAVIETAMGPEVD